MKIKYFKIFLILVLITTVFSNLNLANSKTDSLLSILPSSKGEEKIKLLLELFRENIYNNPEIARKYSEDALSLSLDDKMDTYTCYSYLYLGLSYYFTNQWRISNEYYDKALQTEFADTSESIRATLINNIALNYKFLGNYEKSVEFIYNALEIFEEENDSVSIAMSRGNLGVLYFKLENTDRAIKNYNIALPILTKLKDSLNIANSYENLSDVYFKKKEVKLGNRYFRFSEDIMSSINDSLGLSRLYFKYGENLFSNSNYSEALKYFRKSQIFCDSSVTPNQYYLSLEGEGKSNLYLGRVSESEKLLKRAKNGFKKIGANESIWNNNLILAKLYAKNGNWKNFNKFFNLYELERSNTIKEKEINTVSELNLIYETEKKNRQIEFQQLEISAKNNRILLVSIIAIIITLALFVALFLARKLKFVNKNLVEKNLELSERWNQLQKFYGSAESNTNTNSQNELFRRIYQLMVNEQAYTKTDITVYFLSKQLKSNTKYISKAIKEETGMNFNTFINTFRIEEAKRILRDKISSTWSLDAVAEQSGFNNTTSFFQAFKKNTGLTPTAFRNAFVTSFYE